MTRLNWERRTPTRENPAVTRPVHTRKKMHCSTPGCVNTVSRKQKPLKDGRRHCFLCRKGFVLDREYQQRRSEVLARRERVRSAAHGRPDGEGTALTN